MADFTARPEALSAADPLDASMGQQIRALRRQRGWSLQEVAARAQISIGFLSQMERGLSSPTLRDLIRIAEALGTSLDKLLELARPEAAADGPVVRVAQRRDVAFHQGITKEALTPPGSIGLALYLVTLEPGARTGDGLYAHAGQEAGMVLQGRLLLTVGCADYWLSEGDSFGFPSVVPHGFANAAQAVTRVLWSNAAPDRPAAGQSCGAGDLK
jgi:transcriptional regulator with XRE-family HTH domain